MFDPFVAPTIAHRPSQLDPPSELSIRPSCTNQPRLASPHSSDLRTELGKTATPNWQAAKLRVLDRLDIDGLSALVTETPANNYLDFSLPRPQEVQAEGNSTSDERRRFLGPNFTTRTSTR